MTIEWDSLIAEMVLLSIIIYGSIYFENWLERRKELREEKEEAKKIILLITKDLHNKLRFIEESTKYKDFKPFFTDVWDSVLLGGRQSLLKFETIENLQHTYSWMKYYNNELEQRRGTIVKEEELAEVLEVLGEVTNSIKQSIRLLEG